MKETKVGECFEMESNWYRTVKGTDCDKCVFHDDIMCHRVCCIHNARKDGKNVYFVKATQFDVNIQKAISIFRWVDSLSYKGRIDFYKKLNKKIKERNKLSKKE